MRDMKAVILCGGQGTRLREETEFKPKPMVPIGGMPIIWHIMKIYSHYGVKDFVLCLGYKGEMIKEYFLHQELMAHDVTVNLRKGARVVHDGNREIEDWNVTLADTGLNTMTGARVKRIEKYADGDDFLLTYGDGLADIDIAKLLKHHQKIGTTATLTGATPQSRFGLIKTDERGMVTEFVEKPRMYDEMINGGFYAMKKKFFDYVDDDDSCALEKTPLATLAKEGQLCMYRHGGFWHCMDTYRDYMDLNAIWESGEVPWKVWK
jgi:glucose-1-phosphate cytidylyltransferase